MVLISVTNENQYRYIYHDTGPTLQPYNTSTHCQYCPEHNRQFPIDLPASKLSLTNAIGDNCPTKEQAK